MVELTLPILLSILQTVSLTVGVLYYIFIMRNNQRTRELALKAQETALETRQAQLFMQIYSIFQSSEWWMNYYSSLARQYDDYDDWVAKYGRDANPEAASRSAAVALYFEGIGVLVKKGLIDSNIVADLMQTPIIQYWDSIEDVILEMRDRTDNPAILEWVEYLYNEIKSILEKGNSQIT